MPLETPSKLRKIPFATVIDFTNANLNEAIRLVQTHGLSQVQFCAKGDKGFHVMVYPTSATFYASYSLPRRLGVQARRGGRIAVGVFGLHTIAQARAAFQDVRRKAFAGIDPKAVKARELTYAEFHVEHYQLQCISRQKKSLQTDLGRYGRWIKPELGQVLLPQINATGINKLVVKMQDAGLAAATIRNVIGQLSSSLNLAVELGFIDKNPAKYVKLPRVFNQRTQTFTVSEIKALVTAASRRPETVASRLLMLLAFTGARLGEATNAKWQDMDLGKGLWRLPTQKSGRPGVIYLSEASKALIREVLPFKRNEFVFPGNKGNDQLSRPIRLFRRILQDAQIPGGYRIHDMRHAWCTALIEAGVPIEVISEAARHADSTITRSRYVHIHAPALTAANERFAQLVRPPVVCDALPGAAAWSWAPP